MQRIRVERMFVADRVNDAARHDHRFRLPVNLLPPDDLLLKMIDHYLCLLADGVRVGFDVLFKLLLRTDRIKA